MILCANEEFITKGKDEINKIYSVIKKEMPHLAKWQMKNSYIVDSNRRILCYSSLDDNKQLISSDIKIEYNNGNLVCAKSTQDSLELVINNISDSTVYKYITKLDNGNIVSSRSVLVGTDLLVLTRNKNDNTIEIEGNLNNYDTSTQIDDFEDDLDYLVYCMNKKSKSRLRKNIG